MDGVVWKKAIPYNFVYNLSYSNYADEFSCKINKVSINNKEFSSSRRLEIALEEKKSMLYCKFMTTYFKHPDISISIRLNNTLIFNNKFVGHYTGDERYPCECAVTYNTSLLRQNQINVINIYIEG